MEISYFYQIRLYKKKDLCGVKELAGVDYPKGHLARIINKNTCFVLEANGEIIGFAICKEDEFSPFGHECILLKTANDPLIERGLISIMGTGIEKTLRTFASAFFLIISSIKKTNEVTSVTAQSFCYVFQATIEK